MNHDYTLIRAKRKSISVRITAEGEVVVRCPMKMSAHDVGAFVDKHKDWIVKHLAIQTEKAKLREGFRFGDGQPFCFLGEDYAILNGGENRIALLSKDGLMLPDGENLRKDAALNFLKEQACGYIPPVVGKWSEIMKLRPNGVKITNARTRWGSCSGKDRICFSLRLMCLPPHLIEYVVVHELCHLRHHNHSQKFYSLLESHLPDYRECIAQIRIFQKKILF